MVTRKMPYVAYIPSDMMEKARKGGMVNFSQVAREALQPYVLKAPDMNMNPSMPKRGRRY